MVRETKTLGDGRTGASFRPQDVQVPNIVIWESTRQVQNWEFALAAMKISENPDRQWKIREELERMYGKHRFNYMGIREKLKGEMLYAGLLKWRSEQENGLAQIRKFAQYLKDLGYPEIVQELQP